MVRNTQCEHKLHRALLLQYSHAVYTFNTFSLPTRHIWTFSQDPLASLFKALGTPLASFFNMTPTTSEIDAIWLISHIYGEKYPDCEVAGWVDG